MGVVYGYFTRGVRKNTMTLLALYFWRLSLGVLNALEKPIYTRDTSRGAGSRARGEGREKGNLPATTSKPPVAQRAGGMSLPGRSLCAASTTRL